MIFEFKSIVKKGNGSGTGFAKLPSSSMLKLGEKIKVSFSTDKSEQIFFAKVVKLDGAEGLYIPSNLSKKYDLFGKIIALRIERLSGFGTKAGDDGRIYFPIEYGKNFSLETGDIVLTDIICDSKKQSLLLKIIKRKRKHTVEFMSILGKGYSNKYLQIQLKRKLEKRIESKAGGIDLKELFGNTLFKINEKELTIFDGKKKSIVIPTHISYEEIALYFGAYFADGTKKGNSWGICASTQEQAHYYLKMHRYLIKNTKLAFELSYTLMNSKFESSKLVKKWQKASSSDLTGIKIRMHHSLTGHATKYNEAGTLVIKEHRLAVLKFYNVLLSSLIQCILSTKNRKLAIDFICGVLEGDGTVNAKQRAHIQIATNRKDCPILERILKVTGLRFRAVKEQNNKFYIRIGAMEILNNLPLLKNKIFKFYPKRRKRLFSRISKIGGVRFLFGQQPSAASWVKSSFRKMGILNRDYTLTKFGKTIKDDLYDCIQNANSATFDYACGTKR